MPTPAQILVVEDEQIVARDIQRTLQSLGYAAPEIVDTGDRAVELAEKLQPDLVLMDIRLRGSMDGITAAGLIRERWDIPVVYLTAYADTATLQRARIADPFGYILKPFEERDLHATVEMALYKHKLDRKLRESERWLSSTLSSIGDAVIATDPTGHVVFMNHVAQALTGWSAEDATGQPLAKVFRIVNEHTRLEVESPVARVIATGLTVGLANHTLLISRDGTERPIDDSGAPIQAAGGGLQGVVLVFRDITERKQAEMELRDSERRFKALATHAPVGIFQTDPEGNCQFVNERWCSMAGLSPEEVSGQGMFRALHPDDHDRILKEFTEAIQSGREFASEYRFQTPDKSVTWLSGSAAALRGDDGVITGYIGTVTDITRRKEAEVVLAGVQLQLQTVTDAMSARVARCSRDFRFLWTSKHYANWIGRTSDQIAGHSIKEILGEEAFAQLLPRYERVLKGNTVEHEEEINFDRIGRRCINAVYTPTTNQDGEVDGWVGAIVDITEHRTLETALKEADRRKDEFLATLAHELRNPLAPIKSSVALLKTLHSTDPVLNAARDIIDRQVQHMSRLLDDLLDVNRINMGKLELRKESVQLADIIEGAVETTQPMITARGHRVKISLPSEPIRLDADPIRLSQVFSNLLHNAAKYTDRDGLISLTAERTGGHVVVSVQDNGIGISPTMLPKVFNIFSQEGHALERSEGGLGIGLSLVKGLVELQAGRITAHSDGPGRGSVFTVHLPITDKTTAHLNSSRTHVQYELDPAEKRRLLIVDDLKDSADSLAQVMRSMGHEAETANGGEQALLMAENLRPDIILMDIGMPKMNGYEVCRRIREKPWGQSVVLIALTGWGQDSERRRTQEAGFNHHLVKPADPAELSRMLASLSPAAQPPLH